jgi:transposase
MRNSTTNSAGSKIRFSKAERYQREFRDFCLDELVRDDHQVRTLWAYVCRLDLSEFCAAYKAVEGNAGRKPVDPRILLTLWLMATLEGISSGRRLAQLCQRDNVYRWICGDVGVNHNLLNEFRVSHVDALQGLMSQTIAVLQHQGLIRFNRISQDGIRVRASAGKSSFRKKPTLDQLALEAEKAVEKVLTAEDQDTTNQEQAARLHAAEDRQRRIDKALKEHDSLAETREKRKKGDGEKTRASTTDPDARVMKMADGGFRPAMNIQAATLNDSRLVVAVEATNEGTDSGQMKPMLDFIELEFGERPQEILADGGYNSREDVTEVQQSETTVYSPVRSARKEGVDPYAPRRGDTKEVAEWRQRMKTEEAKEIYGERCSTAEFPFMRFRNHGLQQLPVRGLNKAKVIGIWHAMVSNFQQIVTQGWLSAVT